MDFSIYRFLLYFIYFLSFFQFWAGHVFSIILTISIYWIQSTRRTKWNEEKNNTRKSLNFIYFNKHTIFYYYYYYSYSLFLWKRKIIILPVKPSNSVYVCDRVDLSPSQFKNGDQENRVSITYICRYMIKHLSDFPIFPSNRAFKIK